MCGIQSLKHQEAWMVALLQIFELVGPNKAVQLFGVKLVGVNADNAGKLLFTVGFALLVVLLSSSLKKAAARILRTRDERYRFWTRQAIQVFSALFLVVGLVSIWFDDPTRLATALGLVTAGLAFALQRVVTAVAGYVVILRGETSAWATASSWEVFAATSSRLPLHRQQSWRWDSPLPFKTRHPRCG
jgi:hypothetical protein